MKAMLIRRYGGPEVFEVGELPAKTPGPGEVLIRVRGSSVNPVDAAIRAGALRAFVRLRLPAALGVDLAGEVVELGAGVRRFKTADRVFEKLGAPGRAGRSPSHAVRSPPPVRFPRIFAAAHSQLVERLVRWSR